MTLTQAVQILLDETNEAGDAEDIAKILKQHGAPDRVPTKVLQTVLAVARLLR